MLTEEEQYNVKDFLDCLPSHDLYSLASVVTNKAVDINSKEDAINAILLHETSYLTLLNRKKMTKSILFNYLHFKNVSTPGNLDKGGLINMTVNFWNQVTPKAPVVNNDQICLSSQSQPLNLDSQLAKQFTNWFYNKLNEDFTRSGGEIMTEADFWSDCQTTIYLPDVTEESGSSQTYTASGAAEGARLIRGLRDQYDLYFSPNIDLDGVKGKSDPHGLVMVAACGTLHSRAGECVGVFDQVFGLIADPMAGNNYKIKKTTLQVKKGSNHTPSASFDY